ncbi:MAG TPA: methylamine utilization protein MauE, partial [Burkholderiaceae bacterium]
RAGIDCGCGGASPLPLGRGLLARNGVLLALALVAAWPAAARPAVWLDLVAVGFATLFLLGLYVVANTLLGQHGRLIELRNAP